MEDHQKIGGSSKLVRVEEYMIQQLFSNIWSSSGRQGSLGSAIRQRFGAYTAGELLDDLSLYILRRSSFFSDSFVYLRSWFAK